MSENHPSPGLGDPTAIKVISYDRIVLGGAPLQGKRDLTESSFVRQVELLDQWGFTTLTFDDVRLFEEGKLNLPAKPVILTFNGASGIVYDREFAFLHSLGMRAVVFAHGDQSAYSPRTEPGQGPNAPFMNERQLLEILDFGFEIGSLGVSGQALTDMDRDAAWQEISRSRMTLEFILNAAVKSFAYPDGKVDEQVKQLVAQAGYRIGCSLKSGPRTFGSDPYEIRRVVAPNTDSPALFWLALHGIPMFA